MGTLMVSNEYWCHFKVAVESETEIMALDSRAVGCQYLLQVIVGINILCVHSIILKGTQCSKTYYKNS